MGKRETKPRICVECRDGHHSECLRTYERCTCAVCNVLSNVVVHSDFEHEPPPADEP